VRFAASLVAVPEPRPEGGKLKSAEEVAKEAETFNARASGWAYRLPVYKLEYMTRTLADLVEDKTE